MSLADVFTPVSGFKSTIPTFSCHRNARVRPRASRLVPTTWPARFTAFAWLTAPPSVPSSWIETTGGLKAARPPVVSIHELGTLGGAVSQAKAVNRAGQVVGTSRDALGRTRAFLWQENVGIVDLKPLTGVNTS